MKHDKDLEDLRIYFKAKDRKYTVEREEMLHIIDAMEGFYTFQELYSKARKKNVVHAKSTLYRNLFLFVDAGFIKEIRLLDGKIIYETNRPDEHKNYLLCVGCGKFDSFGSNSIEEAAINLCRKHDFKPLSHNHLIKGYCSDCRKKLKI